MKFKLSIRALMAGSMIGILILISHSSTITARPRKTPPPLKETVILNLDLTKKETGNAQVLGGKWENGWRVTSNNQMMVWDLGTPISKGYIEVSFTVSKSKNELTPGITYLGLYESTNPDRGNSSTSDMVCVRTTDRSRGFSELRVGSPNSQAEKTTGSASSWVADDRTVMKVKVEWDGSMITMIDPLGSRSVMTDQTGGITRALDKLRYLVIGGEQFASAGSEPQSALGIRFLQVKAVALNDPLATTAIPMVAPGGLETSLKRAEVVILAPQ